MPLKSNRRFLMYDRSRGCDGCSVAPSAAVRRLNPLDQRERLKSNLSNFSKEIADVFEFKSGPVTERQRELLATLTFYKRWSLEKRLAPAEVQARRYWMNRTRTHERLYDKRPVGSQFDPYFHIYSGELHSAEVWVEYMKALRMMKNKMVRWMRTREGTQWCESKEQEARRFVDHLISLWGLETLQSGSGVIDIGGDPGFAACEFMKSGIPVTVIDPAWSFDGTECIPIAMYLYDPRFRQCTPTGICPFTVIHKAFNQSFVDDPENADLLSNASALVSMYPDEATDFILNFSATHAKRTALIPCPDCDQFWPEDDPEYEGLVQRLLYQSKAFPKSAWLKWAPLEDSMDRPVYLLHSS